MIGPEDLERTETGGVTHLRGCDVKYDLFRMSQNDIKSNSLNITPFNLMPYLNSREQLNHRENMRDTYLVTTSSHLSVVRACPCTATVQLWSPTPYNVAR